MQGIAGFLRINGSVKGGREPQRWFSIPNGARIVRSRLGLAPAVVSGGMKDWEAIPKQIYASKTAGVLASYLS